MAKFDAARWMVDAFLAGIDVRLNTDGHLVVETLHADIDVADRLEPEIDDWENCKAIMALLPRPGTDARLLH